MHLLSPDSKVSNVLDLSQKVVVRAQNFTQTPEIQLCLWALVIPCTPSHAWGGLEEGQRPGCQKPVLIHLGHSPCGPGETPASLRDSLSSLVKMGGLDPAISGWSHRAHTLQLRRKANDHAGDNGHASWAVTFARRCAERCTGVFWFSHHDDNPTRCFSSEEMEAKEAHFLEITQLVRRGTRIWPQSPCSSLFFCAASLVEGEATLALLCFLMPLTCSWPLAAGDCGWWSF